MRTLASTNGISPGHTPYYSILQSSRLYASHRIPESHDIILFCVATRRPGLDLQSQAKYPVQSSQEWLLTMKNQGQSVPFFRDRQSLKHQVEHIKVVSGDYQMGKTRCVPKSEGLNEIRKRRYNESKSLFTKEEEGQIFMCFEGRTWQGQERCGNQLKATATNFHHQGHRQNQLLG